METTNKIERSELWNKIYAEVKQLPRAQVEGDAVDHPSLTTNLEHLFQSQFVNDYYHLAMLEHIKFGFDIHSDYASHHSNGYDSLCREIKTLKEKLFVELPNDYKEITGFNTPQELAAYEKGREHEEKTIVKFIQNWDGKTNSHMGQILHDKFKEMQNR